jgi:hypothetical protein
MTWEDIMRRVLPPIGGVVPHVTDAGAYGAGAAQGRKPPSSIPHRGVEAGRCHRGLLRRRSAAC